MRRVAYLAVPFAVLLLLGAAPRGVIERHLRAAALLLRFQEPSAEPTGLAAYGVVPVRIESFDIGSGPSAIRGRLFRPQSDGAGPGLVLVHGVHKDGIDEPRLRELARALAEAGLTVLTPEVRSFRQYRVDEESVATIGRAARGLAVELGHDSVGVMGISFGGGVALLSGAHASYGEAIAFVVTIGAHHDLGRVARWYGGEEIRGPNGEANETHPHPYGAGVLIYASAEAFFPAADVRRAREILALTLSGQGVRAQTFIPELSAPSQPPMRAIVQWSLERGEPDSDEADSLRARYLDVMREREGELRAASPRGHLGNFPKPVFLLHGAEDPIVPATETLWLGAELPAANVRGLVVTPFLRHAERAAPPSLQDRWELVQLIAAILDAAEASIVEPAS